MFILINSAKLVHGHNSNVLRAYLQSFVTNIFEDGLKTIFVLRIWKVQSEKSMGPYNFTI